MAPEEDARGNRAAGPQGHFPALRFHVFDQLKRRNVFRVAILYLVVCWLILEPVHVIFHMLDVPLWASRLVVMIMAVGFPAVVIFAWVYEITPEGLKPTVDVPHGQSIRKLTGRRLDAAIIAVLALALTYFVVDKVWISKHLAASQPATATHEMASGSIAAPAAAALNPPPHSIAVLPFVNMSGDKEQEYFSDGLTEELLNSLAEINELQVAARTSAFSFKGKDTDIGTIARKLNVGAVLEGSVRRSGNTVRVTTQLINAVTGFHLWSKTYDRDIGDVLKLQTEIATAVAEALKVALLGDIAQKIELGGTRNAAAFDAYLRASKSSNTFRDGKDMLTAIDEFTEAIRLDPNYALAFADRSLTLSGYAGDFANGPAIRESFDKAQTDAQKTVALAPSLAEGHLALGQFLDEGSLDFRRASEEYERALALAPGNAKVLMRYGRFAVNVGRLETGVAAARRAVVLDPLNRLSHTNLARALHYARRYEEAIASYQDALALDSDFAEAYALRGFAYYALGNFQNARLSCEAKPDYWASQACLAVTYQMLGRHADGEAMLAKLKASQGDDAAYQYAEIYAQWRDTARALQWLDTAVRVRDPGLQQLKTDSLLDPLRKEPRFQAVMRELKFPE